MHSRSETSPVDVVPWKCAGCGALYPERRGDCECSTDILYLPGGRHAHKIHVGRMAKATKDLGACARRVADQIDEFGAPVDSESLSNLDDALGEFHAAAEELRP